MCIRQVALKRRGFNGGYGQHRQQGWMAAERLSILPDKRTPGFLHLRLDLSSRTFRIFQHTFRCDQTFGAGLGLAGPSPCRSSFNHGDWYCSLTIQSGFVAVTRVEEREQDFQVWDLRP